MSPKNVTCSQLGVFIAQLVEHCIGIAEGHGFESHGLKPPEFSKCQQETNCLNCQDKCQDHYADEGSKKITFYPTGIVYHKKMLNARN